MRADPLGVTAEPDVLQQCPAGGGVRDDGAGSEPGAADRAVTALYQAHAVGLVRLGVAMLGDKQAAEDVVQEAFCGLYRRWFHLSDPANSLPYLRSAVLNGCRSAIRRRVRRDGHLVTEPPAASAEAGALIGEEHREVMAALRRLPDRQREALMLRFFLDLDEPGIARSMGISRGTVKSTVSRGLTALGRMLKENA